MIISYKNKFIFIHNPKVAGTSIIKAFRQHGLKDPIQHHKINKFLEYMFLPKNKIGQKFLKILFSIERKKIHSHINAKKLKKITPPQIWNNSFKFGFVRNPWDWQISLYHYIIQTPKHRLHKFIKKKSFSDYLKWKISSEIKLQKDFFYNDNGECLVDFIGKIENLEEDFKKICNKINIQTNLPHLNKSIHKNYQEYYNEETKNLISKYFADDIKLFNYKF